MTLTSAITALTAAAEAARLAFAFEPFGSGSVAADEDALFVRRIEVPRAAIDLAGLTDGEGRLQCRLLTHERRALQQEAAAALPPLGGFAHVEARMLALAAAIGPAFVLTGVDFYPVRDGTEKLLGASFTLAFAYTP